MEIFSLGDRATTFFVYIFFVTLIFCHGKLELSTRKLHMNVGSYESFYPRNDGSIEIDFLAF